MCISQPADSNPDQRSHTPDKAAAARALAARPWALNLVQPDPSLHPQALLYQVGSWSPHQSFTPFMHLRSPHCCILCAVQYMVTLPAIGMPERSRLHMHFPLKSSSRRSLLRGFCLSCAAILRYCARETSGRHRDEEAIRYVESWRDDHVDGQC